MKLNMISKIQITYASMQILVACGNRIFGVTVTSWYPNHHACACFTQRPPASRWHPSSRLHNARQDGRHQPLSQNKTITRVYEVTSYFTCSQSLPATFLLVKFCAYFTVFTKLLIQNDPNWEEFVWILFYLTYMKVVLYTPCIARRWWIFYWII